MAKPLLESITNHFLNAKSVYLHSDQVQHKSNPDWSGIPNQDLGRLKRSQTIPNFSIHLQHAGISFHQMLGSTISGVLNFLIDPLDSPKIIECITPVIISGTRLKI